MNLEICPKCQSSLYELKTGFKICRKCGWEETKINSNIEMNEIILQIDRSQRKAKPLIEIGKMRFFISFHLKCSTKVLDLIHQYTEGNFVIGNVPGIWNGYDVQYFLEGKLLGKSLSFDTDDVRKAILVEEAVKKDCITLISYLSSAKAYIGKENWKLPDVI